VADLGIAAILTHYTIEPAELARFAEEQGFESLWFLQPSCFGYGVVHQIIAANCHIRMLRPQRLLQYPTWECRFD